MISMGQLQGHSLERAELYGKPHVGARYTGKGARDYERTQEWCCICGKPAMSCHHVIPRGRGERFNLVTPNGRVEPEKPALRAVRLRHHRMPQRVPRRVQVRTTLGLGQHPVRAAVVGRASAEAVPAAPSRPLRLRALGDRRPGYRQDHNHQGKGLTWKSRTANSTCWPSLRRPRGRTMSFATASPSLSARRRSPMPGRAKARMARLIRGRCRSTSSMSRSRRRTSR